MKTESLSTKQKNFFENLKKAYGKEPLPSFEKIAGDFGFKHKNSVWQYFNKLKEFDLIKEKKTENSLSILIASARFFSHLLSEQASLQ